MPSRCLAMIMCIWGPMDNTPATTASSSQDVDPKPSFMFRRSPMIPAATNMKQRIVVYPAALLQYPISHNMCSRSLNGYHSNNSSYRLLFNSICESQIHNFLYEHEKMPEIHNKKCWVGRLWKDEGEICNLKKEWKKQNDDSQKTTKNQIKIKKHTVKLSKWILRSESRTLPISIKLDPPYVSREPGLDPIFYNRYFNHGKMLNR